MRERGRSEVWQYFTQKDSTRATCRYCDRHYSFKTTITNLKEHLIYKHGHSYEKKDEDIKEKKIYNRDVPRKVSGIWNYFTKRDDTYASCNLCDRLYSYKATISNLKTHMEHKHGGYESEDEDTSERQPTRRSKTEAAVWKHFSRRDESTATCHHCHNYYVVKKNVHNLRNHLRNKHGFFRSDSDFDSDSDDEEKTMINTVEIKSRQATWDYYEVLDSNKFEAQCKLCHDMVQYDSVSDLKKHIEEHGESPVSDVEDFEDFVQPPRTRKKTAPCWTYFKNVDDENKTAVCLVCKKKLSFATTITNLKSHLMNLHGIDVIAAEKRHYTSSEDESHNEKKILIANGQVYEIDDNILEPETEKQEKEDEKEPIEMDEIYLEEFEDDDNDVDDDIQIIPEPTPETSKNKDYAIKRKFPTIKKDLFKKNRRYSFDERKKPKITAVTSMSPTTVVTTNNTTASPSSGSLDCFGQYIVSLLKELPKTASDKLQTEIIKQIMSTKIALETRENNENSNEATQPVIINNDSDTNVLEKTVEDVIEDNGEQE